MNKIGLLVGLFAGATALAQSTISPPAGVTRVDIPAFSYEPLAVPYLLFQTNANLALSSYLTGGATNTGDRLHFSSHDVHQFNTYVKMDGTGNPTLDGKWVLQTDTNSVLDVQLVPGIGFFASNERFFPQSVYLAGMVPLTAQTVPLFPGYGMMGNPYPAGIRLDSTSLRSDGALGGVDFGTADNMMDWMGGLGGYASYFLVDYPSEPTLHGRWVDENLEPTNPWVKIARGFLYNRNAATTLAWNPPVPYSATPSFNSGATPPAIVNILAGTNGVNLVTFSASTSSNTTYQIFTLDLTPTGMPVFDGGWRLADVTLPATGSNLMSFYDDGTHTGTPPCSTNRPTRLYIVARGDLDFDSDRKSDAVERLRDRSNPAYANADPYPAGVSIALPRRIQVENYDFPYTHPLTGQLIKPYFDGTAGNQGGSYRSDDVDIYTGIADVLDPSPLYVYMDDWEWMSYQVENTNAVSTLYDLVIRYTSIRSTDVAKLSLDGVLIATVSLPDSGLNWFWRSVLVRDISIPPGRHTFSIASTVNYGGRYNLNYLEFLNAGVAPDIVPASPYLGSPSVLPGRVQAEHFDAGYMPEAYYDRSVGNTGSDPSFRSSEHMDVDSYVHEGLPVRTVYMAAYESMGYTVNVPSAGTYDIAIRYGTTNVDQSSGRSPFHLTWPGGTTGPLYPNHSGLVSNLRTHVVRGVTLPAGIYQIRLTSTPDNNYSGQAELDWFEIQPPGVIPDAPTNTPYLGVAPVLPARVQAEHFDDGPMFEAYMDRTYGNTGSDPTFRPNHHVDVDSYVHEGAPVRTIYLSPYESTGYTVNVPLAGNYDIAIRYGTTNVDLALGRSPFRLNWPGGTTGPLYPAHSGWASNLRTHVVRGVALPSGTYQIRLSSTDGSNYSGQAYLDWFEVQHPGIIPEPPSNTPFFGQPALLPGRVEAEHFDNGPMLEAYYDGTAGNTGSAPTFRPNDHVDIFSFADGTPTDKSVYISPGESLGFTVTVPLAGSYDIAFRYGTLNSNVSLQRYPFLLSWPGGGTGPLYPPTTIWANMSRTFVVRNQFLPAGTYQMRLGAYGNYNAQAYVNWFEVQPAGVMPDPDLPSPFFGAPIAIPARIEAEDFDNGNYSVAYFDRTLGNTMGAYRLNTPMEIAAIPDQGSAYQLHLDYGEFVQYSITVPETKSYNLALRVRSQYSGRYLSLWLDGVQMGANVTLPVTGANGMATVQVNNLTLPAGQHVLSLLGGVSSNANSANFFVNHLTFHDASDSDADGLWDNWEWTTILSNPSDNLNTLADITAEGDINGNGVNNLTEYRSYVSNTTVKTVGLPIQAEDYDAGGHLHAYVDTTPGSNQGGAYRADGVDIYQEQYNGDATPDVVYTAGESLNYTLDVPSNGTYDVEMLVGSTASSDQWEIRVDGQYAASVNGFPPPVVLFNYFYPVRPVVARGLSLTQGRHILTLACVNSAAQGSFFDSFRLAPAGQIPEPPVQAPFLGTPVDLPGVVQAENYDAGPSPEAYRDSTLGNSGSAYRPDDHVDIYDVPGRATPSVRVGGTDTEYLNYTVNVVSNGQYDIVLHYANTNEFADFHFYLDGQMFIYGALPRTSNETIYSTYRVDNLSLSEGVHELRFEKYTNYGEDLSGWMVDAFDVVPHVFNSPLPPAGFPGPGFLTLPGIIQAEDFSSGGEGIAYHDIDPTNQFGQYRPLEAVEISGGEDGSDPSPVVAMGPGEWLVWSFNLAQTTTVRMVIRYRLAGVSEVTMVGGLLGTTLEGDFGFVSSGPEYTQNVYDDLVLDPGTYHFKLQAPSSGLGDYTLWLNWLSFSVANDLDGDSLPDDFETLHASCGLSPTLPDAQGDADQDGISNLDEYLNQTDPCVPGTACLGEFDDTDGDCLWDAWEWVAIRSGLQTNLSTLADFLPTGDFDGDSIPNSVEFSVYYSNTLVKTVGPYIQAEDFDAGGHLHAYVDTTPADNAGGSHRVDEGVDIWDIPNSGDDSPSVGSIGGESLNYTVDVPTNGLFDLELELAWTSTPFQWTFLVDGLPVGTATNQPPLAYVPDWYYLRPVVVRDLALAAGRHIITLRNDAPVNGGTAFNRFRLAEAGVIPPVPAQAPFAGDPWAVPGGVQAEDFDFGPMPEAYLDLTLGNAGGVYRTNDHVDIYQVGSNATPAVRFDGGGVEKLNFTVNVASNGLYDLVLRYANTNQNAEILVEVDANIAQYGMMPPSETDLSFTSYRVEAIELSAGVHTIGLVVNMVTPLNPGQHWFLDSFEILPHRFETDQPDLPFPGEFFPSLPGLLQAENFDQGGEGVAYHDVDPTNNGGEYRLSEGVDIYPGDDSAEDSPVVSLYATEWLVWSFELAQTSTVQVTFRYRLELTNTMVLTSGFLGLDSETQLEFAPTGTNYVSTTLGGPITLPPGRHSLKLVGAPVGSSQPEILLNWISIGDPNDLDGDGIPNDWELANGFNPHDPLDANLDPDGDGVTNLVEFQTGTDPHLHNPATTTPSPIRITWPPDGLIIR